MRWHLNEADVMHAQTLRENTARIVLALESLWSPAELEGIADAECFGPESLRELVQRDLARGEAFNRYRSLCRQEAEAKAKAKDRAQNLADQIDELTQRRARLVEEAGPGLGEALLALDRQIQGRRAEQQRGEHAAAVLKDPVEAAAHGLRRILLQIAKSYASRLHERAMKLRKEIISEIGEVLTPLLSRLAAVDGVASMFLGIRQGHLPPVVLDLLEVDGGGEVNPASSVSVTAEGQEQGDGEPEPEPAAEAVAMGAGGEGTAD